MIVPSPPFSTLIVKKLENYDSGGFSETKYKTLMEYPMYGFVEVNLFFLLSNLQKSIRMI